MTLFLCPDDLYGWGLQADGKPVLHALQFIRCQLSVAAENDYYGLFRLFVRLNGVASCQRDGVH